MRGISFKTFRKKLNNIYIVLVILTALIAFTSFSGVVFGERIGSISLWVTVFVIGMYVLVKSADYFTEYSEKLGASLGISQFIIGITVVAIGTSLPELITSAIAVVRGSTEFVAGNVIGSNIADILLIVGLVAIVSRKLKIEWDIVKIDLPLLFGSALLLALIAMDGEITFFEGLLSLLMFFVYIAYSINSNKRKSEEKKGKFSMLYPVAIMISAVTLYFGAKWTVDAVIRLSALLGFVDTSVIALSAVAIGTSLPELSVSLTAARKKNYEMAVGNILGSCVFNAALIVGVLSLVATLLVPKTTMVIGLSFMLGATILFIFSTLDKEVSLFEGSVFVVLYVLFLMKLFGLV